MNQFDPPLPLNLITTLGTGAYQPVVYRFGDRTFQSHLIQEALVEWYQPNKMLVLLTDTVLDHANWRDLQCRLKDRCEIVPIAIPQGSNEQELWRIYEILLDAMEEQSSYLLDVTHGFRSLPLIMMLSVLNLRASRDLSVHSIVYGAKEAPDEENRVPVFDLTMFLDLVDWTFAAEQFTQTGDMRRMGSLLKKIQESSPYKIEKRRPTADEPINLLSIGTAMEELSLALLANHPANAAAASNRFKGKLSAAKAEVARFAKPFIKPLEKIEHEFGFLVEDDLKAHRELIRRYLDRRYLVQAVTLGREWIVSAGCELAGRGADRLVRSTREANEHVLNTFRSLPGEHKQLTEEEAKHKSKMEVEHLVALHSLGTQWNEITDLRNELAHCGMRNQLTSIENIVKKVEKCVTQLEAIDLPSPTQRKA